MKRGITIAICILLGGASAAGGMGFFLSQANADRARLAALVEDSNQRLKRLQQEQEQALENAKKQLASAESNATTAQIALKVLEEEREQLLKAESLIPPAPKTIKNWKQILNVPLGVSVFVPPNATTTANTAQGLILSTETAAVTNPDPRWFSITPYIASQETELLNHVASSTSLSYVVDGRLITGAIGTDQASERGFAVIRVKQKGQNTFLLWIREPSADPKKPQLLTILSTLDFAE